MTKLRALLLSLALLVGLAIAPASPAHAAYPGIVSGYLQCAGGVIYVTVTYTGHLYYISLTGNGTETKTYTDYAYPAWPKTKTASFYNGTWPGYNKWTVRADNVLGAGARCDYGGGTF